MSAPPAPANPWQGAPPSGTEHMADIITETAARDTTDRAWPTTNVVAAPMLRSCHWAARPRHLVPLWHLSYALSRWPRSFVSYLHGESYLKMAQHIPL